MLSAAAHRPFTVLLALCWIAAAAVTWGQVVRTISQARPVEPAGRADAVVWDGFVFTNVRSLKVWLRSRGADYTRWRAVHAHAAAVLGDRPTEQHAAAKAPAAKRSTAPPAKHVAATTTSTAPKHVEAAPRATNGGKSSLFGGLVRVLLLLVAAVLAAGWIAPSIVRSRSPELAARLTPYGNGFAAAAAAIVLGLLIGAVAN